MSKNLGSIDRTIRVVAGLALLSLLVLLEGNAPTAQPIMLTTKGKVTVARDQPNSLSIGERNKGNALNVIDVMVTTATQIRTMAVRDIGMGGELARILRSVMGIIESITARRLSILDRAQALACFTAVAHG